MAHSARILRTIKSGRLRTTMSAMHNRIHRAQVYVKHKCTSCTIFPNFFCPAINSSGYAPISPVPGRFGPGVGVSWSVQIPPSAPVTLVSYRYRRLLPHVLPVQRSAGGFGANSVLISGNGANHLPLRVAAKAWIAWMNSSACSALGAEHSTDAHRRRL